MKEKILKISIITCALCLGFVFVQAQNPFDIEYPIAELNNCGSQEECKNFCDISSNQDVCFQWAKNMGFVKDKPEIHEDFIGPGGCQSEQECEAYCSNKEHGEECLDFSVAEGYITKEEAEKTRIDMNKTGPGGCDSDKSCRAFCDSPDNMEECMKFVVEEGKITEEEAEFLVKRAMIHHERGPDGPGRPGGPEDDIDEEKALNILEELGGGPGGCKNMDECDLYCSAGNHDEECMAFAIEHGLIPPEKIEKMKKMMEMGGPGGCKGPQECDEFCSKEENRDTCMNFAIENEMMPPEEIEMMKKEMEIIKRLDAGAMKGPGGCMGPQECSNYCNNPDHFEECMKFGSDQGMRDHGDMDMKMKDFKRIEMEMKDKGFMFPMFDDGPKDMMSKPGFEKSGFKGMSGGGTGVILKKKSSGVFEFIIMSAGGIKEFSFAPSSGSPYSGGVPGCPKQFKSDSSFFGSAEYPINAVITNCKDEKNEFVIDSSSGHFGGGGDTTPSFKSDGEEFKKQFFNEEYEAKFKQEHENKCDFNSDGTTDEYEAKKCANMTDFKPVPMPIMPVEGDYKEYDNKEQPTTTEPMPYPYIPMDGEHVEYDNTMEPIEPIPTEPTSVSVPELILGTVLMPLLQIFY